MKKMKKRNLFKIAALTAVFALGSMFANAQQTDPTSTDLNRNSDQTKVVKVIDNKGTVKYIQSMNGITQITSTNPGNQTTTTFQLGGTLIDDTKLILPTGIEFAIEGLEELTSGNGYQFVLVDPTTGNLKRLALSDIIDAGTFVKVIATGDAGLTNGQITTGTFEIPIANVTLESFKTVYVFRNGAKLIAGIDYTISTTTGTSTVTLNLNATGTDYSTGYPTADVTGTYENFPLYQGDRVEVQYIK
jgi:hypothetical protein